MNTGEDFVPYKTLKSFGEMPERLVKRVDGFAALSLSLKSFGETCCRDMQSLANIVEDLLQIAVKGLRRDVQSLAIPPRVMFYLTNLPKSFEETYCT